MDGGGGGWKQTIEATDSSVGGEEAQSLRKPPRSALLKRSVLIGLGLVGVVGFVLIIYFSIPNLSSQQLDANIPTTSKTPTTSPVNNHVWELRGQTAIDVEQAMGVWRWIEVFRSGGGLPLFPCGEWVFNLTGSTVELNHRLGRSTAGDNGKLNYTVDTQSPHHWTLDGHTWTWVTTDYANWAVLMRCTNKELSSCADLRILSRERTLPPATLEMLRNVAEQRGFNKSHGRLVDQTSGCSEGEEKAEGNAMLKWTLGVSTENVSTSSVVSAPAWELGGQTEFNLSQTMGGWHLIEVFYRVGRHSPNPCEEFILNLTGTTVEQTRRWGKSGDKSEMKRNYIVDTESPHHWTDGWWVRKQVTTDYSNWAVLMWCSNEELSDCSTLRILSRDRTLPFATLEMLRNVAEQRGFPKARGALGDQTSC